MPHSLTKIWIHLIFGTKERMPLIIESFEKKLYEHLKQIIEKGFKSLAASINGTPDHIHMLQNQNYSIADIAKNIKGNSSHWINQNGFIKNKFVWQTGYSAFSISESMIGEVKKYILNQKEHHKKISFAEEFKRFEEKYGFKDGNR